MQQLRREGPRQREAASTAAAPALRRTRAHPVEARALDEVDVVAVTDDEGHVGEGSVVRLLGGRGLLDLQQRGLDPRLPAGIVYVAQVR